MARNAIQFQKGLGLPKFLEKYATEAACREELFKLCWPDGFRCPECENNTYCELKSRPVMQCHRCHHQTSLTARTLFEKTKLPLTTWFLAIFLLTQSKSGLSAMALARHLGVSYNSARLLNHKIMQTMRERDDSKPLTGSVQVDDAFWGGERRGGKRGRGAAGKTPFVAAVACSADGRPLAVACSHALHWVLAGPSRGGRVHRVDPRGAAKPSPVRRFAPPGLRWTSLVDST